MNPRSAVDREASRKTPRTVRDETVGVPDETGTNRAVKKQKGAIDIRDVPASSR